MTMQNDHRDWPSAGGPHAPGLEAVPRDAWIPALGATAWEAPVQPDATAAMRMSPVDALSSDQCSPAFYLPDLTLDLGGAMLTPGLRDWAGLRLHGLVCNTLPWADSKCEVIFETMRKELWVVEALKKFEPTWTDAEIQQSWIIRVQHVHDHPTHSIGTRIRAVRNSTPVPMPMKSSDGRTVYYGTGLWKGDKDTSYVWINISAISRDFGSTRFIVYAFHKGKTRNGIPFQTWESREYQRF